MHDTLPAADYSSNIPRYFLYIALKSFGFGFFLAIWVIYLQQERGLTLADAALIDATFFVAAALGEVPTGVVADVHGRVASMKIGVALICLSTFGWLLAPNVPLLVAAYAVMGIGATFLSGAEDALFYESLSAVGRGDDYVRLAGRVSATYLGAAALASVLSGLVASISLALPFLITGVCLLLALAVVFTLKEPRHTSSADSPRKPFTVILREALALMRARPAVRYPMLYLALLPMVSYMTDGVFLQPQALALGIPLAGIGIVVMVVNLTHMAGATFAHRLRSRFSEVRLVYAAPLIIVVSLLLLAAFQVAPALLFVLTIGFTTTVLRPLVLGRIQKQVSNDIRATMISMQSLMFTFLLVLTQPTLAFVADRAGLPTAYTVLALALGLLVSGLFWASRRHFPQPVPSN